MQLYEKTHLLHEIRIVRFEEVKSDYVISKFDVTDDITDDSYFVAIILQLNHGCAHTFNI